MSGHFTANQYNDSFSAKRLGNWETRVKPQGKFGTKPQGKTEIIADNRGHLLPHVPKPKFCSPWGNFEGCIWEQAGQQVSNGKGKGVQKEVKPSNPKLPKYFKKPIKQSQAPAKRPQGVKPAVDPILNQLRERRLPIIGMIGLPTEKIFRLRQKFCEELAGAMDYSYINLSDCIEKWKYRQELEYCDYGSQPEDVKVGGLQPPRGFTPIVAPPSASVPPKPLTGSHSSHNISNVSIPAMISPSLLRLVTEYDRTPDRAALAYTSHVNIHRQSRQRQLSNMSIPNATQQQFENSDQNYQTPGNMIQFDLSHPFSRDKIMELLKFAMIENYPTKGYILDGIFLEEGDGIYFEKMFYPPAVCTYFTESAVNNSIDEWNKLQTKRPQPQSQDLVINKQIKALIKLVPPKYGLRHKKYSFIEVEKLCRRFETKVIRVLNAEEANQETIHFVYSLVYKHIKNYPNYSEETKLPFFDQYVTEHEEEMSEADAFLSPVNSAISTSRHKDERIKADFQDFSQENNPEEIPIRVMQPPPEEDFQRIIDAHLPVVWILGYSQADTEERRRNFVDTLSMEMNFAYINLDHELLKWYGYETDVDEDTDDSDHIAVDPKRHLKCQTHEISKEIIDRDKPLTPDNIVMLLKYAMLLSRDVEGYIIDSFPVNTVEGMEFENQIYPSTSLVYFLNYQWTTNKSVQPNVEFPRNFTRVDDYAEGKVENVCDAHGFKGIKVWNAEDLDDEGMTAINNIIRECIRATRLSSPKKPLPPSLARAYGSFTPIDPLQFSTDDSRKLPPRADALYRSRSDDKPNESSRLPTLSSSMGMMSTSARRHREKQQQQHHHHQQQLSQQKQSSQQQPTEELFKPPPPFDESDHDDDFEDPTDDEISVCSDVEEEEEEVDEEQISDKKSASKASDIIFEEELPQTEAEDPSDNDEILDLTEDQPTPEFWNGDGDDGDGDFGDGDAKREESTRRRKSEHDLAGGGDW